MNIPAGQALHKRKLPGLLWRKPITQSHELSPSWGWAEWCVPRDRLHRQTSFSCGKAGVVPRFKHQGKAWTLESPPSKLPSCLLILCSIPLSTQSFGSTSLSLKGKSNNLQNTKGLLCKGFLDTVVHYSKLKGNWKSLRKQKASCRCSLSPSAFGLQSPTCALEKAGQDTALFVPA